MIFFLSRGKVNQSGPNGQGLAGGGAFFSDVLAESPAAVGRRQQSGFNVFNFLQRAGGAFLLKNTIAAQRFRTGERPRLLGFPTRIRTFGTRSNAFLRGSNAFRRKPLLRVPEPPAGAIQTRGDPVKAAPLLTQRYNISGPKANSVKKPRHRTVTRARTYLI